MGIIVKVGRHGSAYGSTWLFASHVRPGYAVISVGPVITTKLFCLTADGLNVDAVSTFEGRRSWISDSGRVRGR